MEKKVDKKMRIDIQKAWEKLNPIIEATLLNPD